MNYPASEWVDRYQSPNLSQETLRKIHPEGGSIPFHVVCIKKIEEGFLFSHNFNSFKSIEEGIETTNRLISAEEHRRVSRNDSWAIRQEWSRGWKVPTLPRAGERNVQYLTEE
jgi:hypothetical protein